MKDHDAVVETTTVGLPRLEPVSERPLAPADRDAVEALPAGSALLIAQTGPNKGARFLLDADETTAGRHPDADIFLDDVTVSRRHAVFTRTDTGFRIVDKGSLNGTYINNDRVDSLELRSGMEIQIGKFRLTYYAGIETPSA